MPPKNSKEAARVATVQVSSSTCKGSEWCQWVFLHRPKLMVCRAGPLQCHSPLSPPRASGPLDIVTSIKHLGNILQGREHESNQPKLPHRFAELHTDLKSSARTLCDLYSVGLYDIVAQVFSLRQIHESFKAEHFGNFPPLKQAFSPAVAMWALQGLSNDTSNSNGAPGASSMPNLWCSDVVALWDSVATGESSSSGSLKFSGTDTSLPPPVCRLTVLIASVCVEWNYGSFSPVDFHSIRSSKFPLHTLCFLGDCAFLLDTCLTALGTLGSLSPLISMHESISDEVIAHAKVKENSRSMQPWCTHLQTTAQLTALLRHCTALLTRLAGGLKDCCTCPRSKIMLSRCTSALEEIHRHLDAPVSLLDNLPFGSSVYRDSYTADVLPEILSGTTVVADWSDRSIYSLARCQQIYPSPATLLFPATHASPSMFSMIDTSGCSTWAAFCLKEAAIHALDQFSHLCWFSSFLIHLILLPSSKASLSGDRQALARGYLRAFAESFKVRCPADAERSISASCIVASVPWATGQQLDIFAHWNWVDVRFNIVSFTDECDRLPESFKQSVKDLKMISQCVGMLSVLVFVANDQAVSGDSLPIYDSTHVHSAASVIRLLYIEIANVAACATGGYHVTGRIRGGDLSCLRLNMPATLIVSRRIFVPAVSGVLNSILNQVRCPQLVPSCDVEKGLTPAASPLAVQEFCETRKSEALEDMSGHVRAFLLSLQESVMLENIDSMLSLASEKLQKFRDTLDSAQYAGVVNAMRSTVSVLIGPPGTGKSHVSSRTVALLLWLLSTLVDPDNPQTERPGPILVLAVKNAQINVTMLSVLRSLLPDFGISEGSLRIARLGSGGANCDDGVKSRTVVELLKKSPPDKESKKAIYLAHRAAEELKALTEKYFNIDHDLLRGSCLSVLQHFFLTDPMQPNRDLHESILLVVNKLFGRYHGKLMERKQWKDRWLATLKATSSDALGDRLRAFCTTVAHHCFAPDENVGSSRRACTNLDDDSVSQQQTSFADAIDATISYESYETDESDDEASQSQPLPPAADDTYTALLSKLWGDSEKKFPLMLRFIPEWRHEGFHHARHRKCLPSLEPISRLLDYLTAGPADEDSDVRWLLYVALDFLKTDGFELEKGVANTVSALLNVGSLRERQIVDYLSSCNAVFATISGASLNSHLLQAIRPSCICLEEGAEILPSEVLSILSPNITRIVFNGDHMQLRAIRHNHPLVNMLQHNKSLFELLASHPPAVSGSIFALSQLNLQRRALPALASLVKPVYPFPIEDDKTLIVFAQCVKAGDRFESESGFKAIKGRVVERVGTLTSKRHNALSEAVAALWARRCFSEEHTARGMISPLDDYGIKPVVFVTHGNAESHEKITNNAELEFALALLHVWKFAGVPLKNVTVLSYFEAQLSQLVKQVDIQFPSEKPTMSTVDSFQGNESPIVVVMTTRVARETDHLRDQHRRVVMLSRAKYFLVVIGNAEFMRSWDALQNVVASVGVVVERLWVRCPRHVTEAPRYCLAPNLIQDFSSASPKPLLNMTAATLCDKICDVAFSNCHKQHRCARPCHFHLDGHTDCNHKCSIEQLCCPDHRCKYPCSHPGECLCGSIVTWTCSACNFRNSSPCVDPKVCMNLVPKKRINCPHVCKIPCSSNDFSIDCQDCIAFNCKHNKILEEEFDEEMKRAAVSNSFTGELRKREKDHFREFGFEVTCGVSLSLNNKASAPFTLKHREIIKKSTLPLGDLKSPCVAIFKIHLKESTEEPLVGELETIAKALASVPLEKLLIGEEEENVLFPAPLPRNLFVYDRTPHEDIIKQDLPKWVISRTKLCENAFVVILGDAFLPLGAPRETLCDPIRLKDSTVFLPKSVAICRFVGPQQGNAGGGAVYHPRWWGEGSITSLGLKNDQVNIFTHFVLAFREIKSPDECGSHYGAQPVNHNNYSSYFVANRFHPLAAGAIVAYTGSAYLKYNEEMRELPTSRKIPKRLVEFTYLLCYGLWGLKSEYRYQGKIYRHVGSALNDYDHVKPGSGLVLWGATSCSTEPSKNVVFGKGKAVVIVEGIVSFQIKGLSEYPSENEYLIPPMTTALVSDIIPATLLKDLHAMLGQIAPQAITLKSSGVPALDPFQSFSVPPSNRSKYLPVQCLPLGPVLDNMQVMDAVQNLIDYTLQQSSNLSQGKDWERHSNPCKCTRRFSGLKVEDVYHLQNKRAWMQYHGVLSAALSEKCPDETQHWNRLLSSRWLASSPCGTKLAKMIELHCDDQGVRETLLLHGTKLDYVGDLSSEPDFLKCCGMLGCGFYLADSFGKAVQYAQQHSNETITSCKEATFPIIIFRAIMGHKVLALTGAQKEKLQDTGPLPECASSAVFFAEDHKMRYNEVLLRKHHHAYAEFLVFVRRIHN